MLLEALISTALSTGLALLSKATGLEATADARGQQLIKGLEDKARQKTLEQAAQSAAQKSGIEGPLQKLIQHRPFQEEVVRALLDPVKGFDLEAATRDWSEKFPEYTLGLRKYFNTLQNILGMDEYWSAVIEHYQKMRMSPEAQQAIKEKRLPATELELVQQVSSVMMRGNNNQMQIAETIVNQYIQINVPPPDPMAIRKAETDAARSAYLASFYNRMQHLPLTHIGASAGKEDEITLDSVYIALNTTTEIELSKSEQEAYRKKNKDQEIPIPKKRLVTALEAAQQQNRIVLLGDPGSGKSTFVKKLLAQQAQVGLGQKPTIKNIPQDLLPVLVTLRDLGEKLAQLESTINRLPEAERRSRYLALLETQLLEDLEKEYRQPDFKEGMMQALHQGKVLLVLDGLDEVGESFRPRVRDLVWAVCYRCQISRIMVTCRIRSYVSAESQIPDFSGYRLADLNEDQIETFCHAWYGAQKGRLGAETSQKRADSLWSAIQGEDRIAKLAGNPMLLTTIACIHQRDTILPDQRVKLYHEAVEILLQRWQMAAFGEAWGEKHARLKQALQGKDAMLRRLMEHLAYEAHKRGDGANESGDLPRYEAMAIIAAREYLGTDTLASDFLDYVDQRAGLLVGRGGEPNRPAVYSFPHRTFQEYLTGCYLLGEGRAREVLELLEKHATEAEKWTLPVELGAEEILYNGTRSGKSILLDIANLLIPEQPGYDRLALWGGITAALAGVDTVQKDKVTGTAYLERAQHRLVELLGSHDLTPPERADAGNALARLGDPRIEVMTVENMRFCHVPAGKFWMGSDDDDHDERPKHKLELPEFWISQYPITQAQFDQFVLAGGYENKTYWTEAEAAGYWSVEGFKGRFDKEPRKNNVHFGEPLDLLNHPVVGVSWYEALAFCRWLQGQMQQQGQFWDANKTAALEFKKGWRVQLPSEAEWEKAARGTDGRVYPWGDAFDANRANTDETGIKASSTVGCFMSGITPYGVVEMSGNVWEWTRSIYMDYPYQVGDKREDLNGADSRVMRGGSFYFDSWRARCVSRNWHSPYFRDLDFGFRIILSPPLS